MQRYDIINTVGDKYHTENIENGEFSYPKAFGNINKDIKDYQQNRSGQHHDYIDLRFENDRLVILIETKSSFSYWKKDKIEQQLQDYVRYEKALTGKTIVAILAETNGDEVRTWLGQSVIIDNAHEDKSITKILSFNEYEDLCFGKVNDRIKIVDSIKTLNEMLHTDGINERLRSQFVGTCLLALKNGLVYKQIKPTIDEDGNELKPEQTVLNNIRSILSGLLSRKDKTINKAGKLSILTQHVLEDQDVMNLNYRELQDILNYINDKVVPYINDKNTAGQDLLNLFFTTFNKYVGKSDKNQAFTPDHICDFMTKAIGVNAYSRILDPCCGSGSFLVRSMTAAMDACSSEDERYRVKTKQIYGIEYENTAYGLASTNMLIHGDGNSNVVQDSMFNRGKWIKEAHINTVLMNPPYNATRKFCNPKYVSTWKKGVKKDPSKGFHYVYWVAKHIEHTAKMAVLLPMQAAIGNSEEIKKFKKKMLRNYTLDAVFSLPDDVFYPGAAVVACCMIFDLSQPHKRADRDTFFGYFKNDEFEKRKSTGRVEKVDKDGNSLWRKTEKKWLDLYNNKREVPGLSVMHKITYKDEWLAEAYMETDYSKLKEADFQKTINEYLAFIIQDGGLIE